MRRIWDWIVGWYVTLHIRHTNRELYDFLVNYEHDPDDFVEVFRPE